MAYEHAIWNASRMVHAAQNAVKAANEALDAAFVAQRSCGPCGTEHEILHAYGSLWLAADAAEEATKYARETHDSFLCALRSSRRHCHAQLDV